MQYKIELVEEVIIILTWSPTVEMCTKYYRIREREKSRPLPPMWRHRRN